MQLLEPLKKRSRSSRTLPRPPSPLPGWLQAVVLLLFVFSGHSAPNRLLTSTDAANIVVRNTYDQVGNKLSVQDGRQQTTLFAYDGLDRNTLATDPAGRATLLTYDGQNKTQRKDALGQITTYLYDNRNRLQYAVYNSTAAANSQRQYAYDRNGNLLSVTEATKPAANVAYTYDALNRAVTETSNGVTHAYAYDPAGNRLQTLYGAVGASLPTTTANAQRTIASTVLKARPLVQVPPWLTHLAGADPSTSSG